MENKVDFNNFLSLKSVYSKEQERAVRNEFIRLEECYLDNAGSALYSEKQLQEVFSDFSKNVYSNPHATSVLGKSTDDAIDIVRYQILQHFNTNGEEYSVIFTSNATASLKTIAECFNYGENSKGTFVHLETNHTSVLGMRNYAENVAEIKIKDAFNLLSKQNVPCEDSENSCNNLFVYPAQCNFSGTKFPLDWMDNVKKGGLNQVVETKSKNWYVVLDCANYLSTNNLDLSLYKPDFIPISFYKIFGFPTGIGALLVRRSSENLLVKKYFGGGTVFMALSSRNVMIPRTTLHEKFEDGTLPFLSILAIKHGFNTYKRLNLNFDLISNHTFSLAQYTFRNLLTLHHFNGKSAAVLYHDTIFETSDHQGAIINFNLLRANGDFIGYSEVMHMANLHGISLRTGCFCNPGACQRFLNLQPVDVEDQFKAGHVCGDQNDLIKGRPTGSVRISFGYMSTVNDAQKFLEMIESCFVETPILKQMPKNWLLLKTKYLSLFANKSNFTTIAVKKSISKQKFETINQSAITNEEIVSNGSILQGVFLYPIKSCGAFSVKSSWELTKKGLKYDREWMIVNSAGICITQKHNKKLCLIKPSICLETKTMRLEFKYEPSIEIPLEIGFKELTAHLCQSKICGNQVQGWDCGDDISDWLSKCLDTPGLRLLRQYDEIHEDLSFANKAQYLLINVKSVEWLVSRIQIENFSEDLNSVVMRFRPNFVINLECPFQENDIEEFSIDKISFQSTGKCTRCQMICINQMTGIATKEPLVTLSKEFKGKISFGVYLKQNESDVAKFIKVGSKVLCP